MRRAPIVLHTNSISAIQSIVSLIPSNPLVQLIRNRVAVSSTKATFCWVPSHTRVPENERADAAAKDTTSCGRVRKVELPRGDVKAYCKRVMIECWRLKWKAVTGKMYRERTNSVRPLPNATCSERSWEVILTWLRIGQTTLTDKHLMEGRPQPYSEDG